MRAVSKKRAREQRIYTKLRAEHLEANPWCVWPLGCGQPATEIHHRRGRVGALYLATEHWSGLCHSHHQRATERPAEAYRLGISERRVAS